MTNRQDHKPEVRLRSIGVYLPERRESNIEKAKGFGFPPGFVEEKVGVLARSVKEPDETRCDLCVRAFDDLCSRTTFHRADIQLAVVVTQHPDVKVPHSAAIVHNRLGLAKHCMTFDISQGCAGYTHAVTTVVGLMDAAKLDHALLFTSDPYSDKLDQADKDASLLFGDAATVTYFARTGPGYRLVDCVFGTLPDSFRCLYFDDRAEMDGAAVFRYAVREVPPSIEPLLRRNGLTTGDIDLFLLHQASKYLVEYVSKKMGIPAEKAPYEAGGYGNTLSSSIPLLLQKHVAEAVLQRILLSGFGVGFTWGNNLLELART